MSFEYLEPELREKAEACTTPEELMKLAADEGYELSDEEIESISGGSSWSDDCGRFKNRRLINH